MVAKALELIGAGQGWGARYPEVQKGPQVLKTLGLLQVLQKKDPATRWRCDMTPADVYTAGKMLSYPERLAQVVEFSKHLVKEVTDSQKTHFPVILGGDHTIAIGTWSAVATALQAQGEFGLIWMDAHMDAHTPQTTPSFNIHGMPLAVLLGEGEEALVNIAAKGAKIRAKHLVLIGVRSFEAEEAELLKNLQVKIYFMEEVKQRGFSEVFQEAVKIVSQNTKGFGVSIDMDFFDPSIAPGTGTPEKNGIVECIEVLHSLINLRQDPKFKALEITEFDPSRDIQHQTATLIQDLISALL